MCGICDGEQQSEEGYHKHWLTLPAKFCTSCGSKESFDQHNYNKDCQCGGGTFLVMTQEQADVVRKAFDIVCELLSPSDNIRVSIGRTATLESDTYCV